LQLAASNPDFPYILSADASGVGIRAVLEQLQGDDWPTIVESWLPEKQNMG